MRRKHIVFVSAVIFCALLLVLSATDVPVEDSNEERASTLVKDNSAAVENALSTTSHLATSSSTREAPPDDDGSKPSLSKVHSTAPLGASLEPLPYVTDGSDGVVMPSCARQYFEVNFQQSRTETQLNERRAARIPRARIDQVYMIHYTPMKKRRAAMTTLLAQHNVSANWVLGFDKQVLNESTAACFHRFDVQEQRNTRREHRHDFRKWVPLGPAQRSVVVKHHSALYDAYRYGYDNIMVLEDDAYLRVQFIDRLASVMDELRSIPYDVVMIGGCMNLHGWRRKFQAEKISKHLYRKREARCAHAFVASRRGVQRLLSSLPLTQAIDFQMTSAMNEFGMDVYWVEPYLSIQGPSTECVTGLDLGAGCGHSTMKITKDFNVTYLNDPEVSKWWEIVPAFHSKR